MDLDAKPEVVTVLTWNLQGSHGIDTDAVAAVIRGHRPDVVLLQEIQRGQCRRLAAALGMRRSWVFKNISGWAWPEGMAVLTPHVFAATSKLVLRRSLLLTWRRRVAVLATIEAPRTPIGVIDVHLSPHDEGDARRREATTVLEHAGRAVVGGDFNDRPGGAAPTVLEAAGWTDSWARVRPGEPGFTNWTPGPRIGRPPDQRLDYVMAPPGWTVLAARVGSDTVGRIGSDTVAAASADHERLAELSDHLPLVVRLSTPEGAVT